MTVQELARAVRLVRRTLLKMHNCIDEKASPRAHAALMEHHEALRRAGELAGLDVAPLSGGLPKPPRQ